MPIEGLYPPINSTCPNYVSTHPFIPGVTSYAEGISTIHSTLFGVPAVVIYASRMSVNSFISCVNTYFVSVVSFWIDFMNSYNWEIRYFNKDTKADIFSCNLPEIKLR